MFNNTGYHDKTLFSLLYHSVSFELQTPVTKTDSSMLIKNLGSIHLCFSLILFDIIIYCRELHITKSFKHLILVYTGIFVTIIENVCTISETKRSTSRQLE